jgi:hypothetical protein
MAIIEYSLFCLSCKRREPNEMIIITGEHSLVNKPRPILLKMCANRFSKRACSYCQTQGNYAVWLISCGDSPKQIHLQMTREKGNLGVVIWDENHTYLNNKLENLQSNDSLCQLLLRALIKLDVELYNITSLENNSTVLSSNHGFSTDTFYMIYEEDSNHVFDYKQLGEMIFVENNFNYSQLKQLIAWIEQNLIFKQ